MLGKLFLFPQHAVDEVCAFVFAVARVHGDSKVAYGRSVGCVAGVRIGNYAPGKNTMVHLCDLLRSRRSRKGVFAWLPVRRNIALAHAPSDFPRHFNVSTAIFADLGELPGREQIKDF